MKEIIKSKVMVSFIIFILAVGFINVEQVKVANASLTNIELSA